MRAESDSQHDVHFADRGFHRLDVLYLSVHCRSSEPVTFRALALLSAAEVTSAGELIHGEVCNEWWAYHFYEQPELAVAEASAPGDGGEHRMLLGEGDGSNATAAPPHVYSHVKFFLRHYTGDMTLVTRHGEAPVKHARRLLFVALHSKCFYILFLRLIFFWTNNI